MWRDLFSLDLSVAEKVLRPILVYAFLAVALRLAGKRELAQLTPLDFVVLLSVSNAVQNGIIGTDDSVTGGVIGAATLLALNATLAFVLYRNARLRRVVEGRPTVLIEDGVVAERALRHEELSVESLLSAVQVQGAREIEDVERALLMPNGTIVTILRRPDDETEHFLELSREISELKAMVAALRS